MVLTVKVVTGSQLSLGCFKQFLLHLVLQVHIVYIVYGTNAFLLGHICLHYCLVFDKIFQEIFLAFTFSKNCFILSEFR